jgi:hypothetical protein
MTMPLWLFLVLSFAVAVTTGFANSFHGTLMAQAIGGVLSILSLAAVVAAFCFYGWKIGLLDLPVVLTAANVGVSLFQSREEIRGFSMNTTRLRRMVVLGTRKERQNSEI